MRFLCIIRVTYANLILAGCRSRPATAEKEVEQEVTYNKGDAWWRQRRKYVCVFLNVLKFPQYQGNINE